MRKKRLSFKFVSSGSSRPLATPLQSSISEDRQTDRLSGQTHLKWARVLPFQGGGTWNVTLISEMGFTHARKNGKEKTGHNALKLGTGCLVPLLWSCFFFHVEWICLPLTKLLRKESKDEQKKKYKHHLDPLRSYICTVVGLLLQLGIRPSLFPWLCLGKKTGSAKIPSS